MSITPVSASRKRPPQDAFEGPSASRQRVVHENSQRVGRTEQEFHTLANLFNAMASQMTGTLILSKKNLQLLPKEIGNLTQLTGLILERNQLTSLPSEIGNLKQLALLLLGNNQLRSVPKEIGNLRQLTVLGLGINQLRSVPKEIGNLTQLAVLLLGNNQLASVPSEIGNLKHLKKLDLRYNLLTSFPMKLVTFIKNQDFELLKLEPQKELKDAEDQKQDPPRSSERALEQDFKKS